MVFGKKERAMLDSKRSIRDSISFIDESMLAKSKRSTRDSTSFVDRSMIVKSKRSQAAMEFLMTYGWAILAAVIVIGVLAYFGVFSPGTYVPNQCVLAAPLGCNAGVANAANVQLEIRNGAGESLDITSIAVAGCGTDSTGWTVADQSLTSITVACSPALTAGDKFQGAITVSYTKTGSALTLTSTGRLVDTV